MAGDSQAGGIAFFCKDQVLYDLKRILGHDVSNVADELVQLGAEEVVVANDAALAEYEPRVWAIP